MAGFTLALRAVTSAQDLQDRCVASAELVARQPERTNIVGWLRIVARREAIRLARYDRRLVALGPRAPMTARQGGAPPAGHP
jgi:hypothetical protein